MILDFKRYQLMMSMSTELIHFELPRLDSDLDRSVLARPERRQATARLRREYTESRDDNYEDDKRMIRERTKFAEQMKLVNALLKEQKACVIPVRRKPHVDSAFRKIWQQQIHKINLPTRIIPSRKLEIATPIMRQPIYSKVRNPAPMFRTTSAQFSSDREKRRMHFISTEWKSEGVSWVRFHKTDLRDIHKLGWI